MINQRTNNRSTILKQINHQASQLIPSQHAYNQDEYDHIVIMTLA
jgi:hypothetical protein